MAGWFPLFARSDVLSQRSVLNIGFVSGAGKEYRFINHFQITEQFGPVGSSFSTGTPWPKVIGSSGFPVSSIQQAAGNVWGGGVRIPASWQYGAVGSGHYYVFRFSGSAEFRFSLGAGSITLQAGPVTGPAGSVSSNHVDVVSAGSRWKTTPGTVDTYMVFNYTGPDQLFSVHFLSNDPDGVGATGNVRNVQFYRLDDEQDMLAGNVFRTPYKQSLVDYCPSAVRFMDWIGGNNSRPTRFDTTRNLPNYPAWGGGNAGSNWVASPAYDAASFVDATGTANQYTVAAATGTTGNTQTTPVSPLHGEVVTCRMDSAQVRCNEGSPLVVSGVTNASPGVVTTTTAHGYNTGDIVVHQFGYINRTGILNSNTSVTEINISGIVAGMRVDHPSIPIGTTVVSATGITVTLSAAATATVGTDMNFQAMPKLHLVPCKITVTDSTHYSIASAAGVAIDTTSMGTFSGNATSVQFTTLDVGGRGARPIIFPSVTTFASTYGNDYIALHDYKTFIYDKTIAMQADGAGNLVYGAWIFNNSGPSNGHDGGVPLEICVALVNEVNAMGPAHPIGMWMNIPHMATSSMDPDYTTASNWGVQATNVVLNGSTVGGVIYPGLTAPAKLFIEYSNETWLGPDDPRSQTGYCSYRGYLRWTFGGGGDKVSMTALRSAVAMNDIATSAYYNSSRVKFVLSGQGTTGAGANNINQLRIDGTSYSLNDPSNPGGAPMTHHDYFAIAGYFNPNDGGSYDFSALVTSWVSHIGNPTAQEADCATYVAAMVNTNGTVTGAGGETMWRYGTQLVPALASKLAPPTYGANKAVIMYEGGWNTFIFPINSPQSNFTVGTLDGSTNVITGVDAGFVSSLAAGYLVYGYGIPDDTVVVSATGTSITLSKNTTVALTWGQFMVFTPTDAFLRACKRSQAWATAMLNYFGDFNIANAGMPSDYVQSDLTFGVIYPSSYGFKNAEWTDMNPAWFQFGARNRGLN